MRLGDRARRGPGAPRGPRPPAVEGEFLAALVGSLDAAVVACDSRGRLLVTNATYRHYGGYRPHEVAVGSRPTTAGLWWPDGRALEADEHPLLRVLRGERVKDLELVFDRGGRSQRRVVSTNGTVLKSEDGRLLGAVAAFHDVTAAKRAALELTELALHDPLTRCANRLLLSERAELACQVAARDGSSVGLLLVDLDDCKSLNDTHGHLVGDEILVDVGRRLRSVVRPSDTVARYGGDEFVVLVLLGAEQDIASLEQRVARRLAEPFAVGGVLLEVGASIGAAVATGPEVELGRLLHAADGAMYRQKLARRDRSKGSGQVAPG